MRAFETSSTEKCEPGVFTMSCAAFKELMAMSMLMEVCKAANDWRSSNSGHEEAVHHKFEQKSGPGS